MINSEEEYKMLMNNFTGNPNMSIEEGYLIEIKKLKQENINLRIQISARETEYDKLETKLRHIEQYFDDLDDIDYKTIKYEVEKILKKDK